MNELKLTLPWEEIEEGAQKQIEDTLKLPFVKKLAIMPDVHMGYDLPIGGVALLDDYIWPGAVGYDIGCGMCHLDLQIPVSRLIPSKKSRTDVRDRITKMVPVGFNKQDRPMKPAKKFPNATGFAAVQDAINIKASEQLGTLGGGNHFIEIGVNSGDSIGITIHSGSRRPGWLIGDLYMKLTGGPVELNSELGQAYAKDMCWALLFALQNRKVMMEKCLIALGFNKDEIKQRITQYMINENHNHAVITDEGVLHRKGATPAEKGKLGIIPANMQEGVWITRGYGNEEFLNSASHGAGRKMSRTKATKTLDKDVFKEQMGDIVTPDLNGLLDEAPGAYKDIGEVLKRQEGILVDIIDHFEPVIVIKG